MSYHYKSFLTAIQDQVSIYRINRFKNVKWEHECIQNDHSVLYLQVHDFVLHAM